jgi:hypothetical protein
MIQELSLKVCSLSWQRGSDEVKSPCMSLGYSPVHPTLFNTSVHWNSHNNGPSWQDKSRWDRTFYKVQMLVIMMIIYQYLFLTWAERIQ